MYSSFFLLIICSTSVLADVKFLTPAADALIHGNSFTPSWEESGIAPPISDFGSYIIDLCAGGNKHVDFDCPYNLVAFGDYGLGTSGPVTFPTTLGADVKNAYFLRISSAGTSATIINYSDRFSLLSMTGVFTQSINHGLDTVNGTSGPPTETCSYALTTCSIAPTSTPASGSQKQSSGLSISAATGIAVAGIAILIGLSVLAFWFLRRRRRTRSHLKIVESETELKPQLDDTSEARNITMLASAHEMSHEEELHEADRRRTPPPLPRAELGEGARGFRYELDTGSERSMNV